jgi:hypothetical protein
MTVRARWLLLGTCVLLRVVSLVRPCLSDDEAIYCVVAREMLKGKSLYRDIVDHKPPLIYVTYAATQALGGPIGGMRLLHAMTILVVFATALTLAHVARQLSSERWNGGPTTAAFLYVLFTTTLLDFDSLAANCELFMMLPLTASVAVYLRGAKGSNVVLIASCGALVAIATFYKYQAAIHLPLYAMHFVVINRRRPRFALAGCTALGAGFLASAGLGVVILGAFDSLASAWFWFRFNFAYIKEGLNPGEVFRRGIVRVSFIVGAASCLWALGVRSAVGVLARGARPGRQDMDTEWLVTGWLGVSLAAVAVGGRFFGHYFHQVTGPLAVLAAPTVARLWRRRPGLIVAWIGVPVVTFFLVAVFHGEVMAAAGAPDPDYDTIARFIDTHSRADEELVVWGNSPVLYFMANRPLGSRFVFSNYLTGLSPATRTQSDPAADASANVVPAAWDMFEYDLASHKPAVFVDLSAGDVAGYGKFPPARFPRLNDILEHDYVFIGQVAGGRVLRRRADIK